MVAVVDTHVNTHRCVSGIIPNYTQRCVYGIKWVKLPGKSVFSTHKHARNLALKWLICRLDEIGLVCYVVNITL